MNSSPLARNARPLAEGPAAEETPSPKENPFSLLVSAPAGSHVGDFNEITLPRLIYFDQGRASELLEDVSSSMLGRKFLADLATHPGVGFSGALEQPSQRAMLSLIMVYQADLEVAAVNDLYQSGDVHRQSSWEEFHPDQAVIVKGAAASARDVQPSSLQLKVGKISVRVYVERDRFLHLNQKYLTNRPVIAVGKVRSVARHEMRAAAIGAPAKEDAAEIPYRYASSAADGLSPSRAAV